MEPSRKLLSQNKSYFLAGTAMFLAAAPACQRTEELSGSRPNIVFILVDDLGYMDLGGYAQRISGAPTAGMFYETPHVDALISNGIAFSQAYACPLCAPTRASILTGKYASRLGFTTAVPHFRTFYNANLPTPEGYYIHDVIYHHDPVNIPHAWNNASNSTAIPRGHEIDGGRKETVLLDVMNDYHAAFIGKWHLGGVGADGYAPADHGFEEIAWFDAGGSHYFNWRDSWNDTRKTAFPDMPQDKWIRGNAGEKSEHEYLTDDLTEKAVSYIRRQAKNKDKPFFLYLCHFAVHTPIQAPDEDIAYFDSKETKGWNDHNNTVYAGMIKRLDDGVGRVMQVLEETGLDDNTIVVFMSDNGGVDRQFYKISPTVTSNEPLKAGKATVFEGGIRVPLIFSWKGKIASGQWCDVPVDVNDLFPTILDFAGFSSDNMDIDGQSLLPLMADPLNKSDGYHRDTFFWHYPFNVSVHNPDDGFPLTPHSAIRKGDYKLVFDWHGRLKLYNIREDISETNNLLREQPGRASDMFSELIAFLEENVGRPYWPQLNPDYDPALEVRDVPFVDLYKAYKEGKDVAALANE